MLKPLTLEATTSCVSSMDPAIDREASDLQKYGSELLSNSNAWRELLKFKSGEKPTVFVLGVIPPDEMSRINDETPKRKLSEEHTVTDWSSEELQWRSFLTSLRDIEGWESGEIPKRKVGGVEYIDPSWLRKTFVRGLRKIALEVGLAAYFWNMLTETETKN